MFESVFAELTGACKTHRYRHQCIRQDGAEVFLAAGVRLVGCGEVTASYGSRKTTAQQEGYCTAGKVAAAGTIILSTPSERSFGPQLD